MEPLLQALCAPDSVPRFSPKQWDRLLRTARREKLLGYLHYLLQDRDLASRCPPRAIDTLKAGAYRPAYIQTQVKREVRAVERALDGNCGPLVLLKGAAYLFAKYPFSRGRYLSDADILVPRTRLARVEQRLLDLGWQSQKIDGYDQRYYREWMHEIPPLKHPQRGVEVDVHHALLPLTARVRPDPELLWEASLPVGDGQLRLLAPVDMVLHSATHLFYDGEIKGGLRDLVDLHELFRHFGKDPQFWNWLPERAGALNLTRPLFYALRYCSRLLATEIPPEIVRHAKRNWAPAFPVRKLMDSLVQRVFQPRLPEERGSPLSTWLLYLRSHWLRMPPWLLAKHLSRKFQRRLTA